MSFKGLLEFFSEGVGLEESSMTPWNYCSTCTPHVVLDATNTSGNVSSNSTVFTESASEGSMYLLGPGFCGRDRWRDEK